MSTEFVECVRAGKSIHPKYYSAIVLTGIADKDSPGEVCPIETRAIYQEVITGLLDEISTTAHHILRVTATVDREKRRLEGIVEYLTYITHTRDTDEADKFLARHDSNEVDQFGNDFVIL